MTGPFGVLIDSLGATNQSPELTPSQALSGLTVHLSSLSDSRKIELKVCCGSTLLLIQPNTLLNMSTQHTLQDPRQGICLFWVHQNPCSSHY